MSSFIKQLKSAIKQVNNFNSLHTEIAQLCANITYNNRAQELNDYVLHSKESGITDMHYCDHEIIIPLTTYEPRLYEVYLAIESIMQQTMKANRIILWLSDTLKHEPLPATIQLQTKRGLEVRYCKDIRSYKKLIPSLKAFPNDSITTIDDDLIYHIDVIEKLIHNYLKDPQYIYFNRGCRISFQENNLSPYLEWKECIDTDISILNFPTGGAGALYPPHIFNDEIFNESVFMSICPYGDDIWFKAMALYNSKLSRKVYTHDKFGDDFLCNPNVQECALHHINNGQLQNDKQIKAVFEKYRLHSKILKQL